MTGVLDKFHVEHSVRGTRVLARSRELTPNCLDDVHIDANIQLLKEDLDTCAKEMKRLAALERRGSMFEGWALNVE